VEAFPLALALALPFALPLDLADAVGAFAADVFGELDEAEDVFLWGEEGRVVS
jgi:hypothetical protein